MQDVENLTKEYEKSIIKIMIGAVRFIKIPLAPAGLFAFLRGDRHQDAKKNEDFFKFNLYSIFSNFSLKHLSIILNTLLKEKLLELSNGTLAVTPRGDKYMDDAENEKIHFLYRF